MCIFHTYILLFVVFILINIHSIIIIMITAVLSSQTSFILLKRFQVAQTYVYSVESSDHCFLFVQKKITATIEYVEN